MLYVVHIFTAPFWVDFDRSVNVIDETSKTPSSTKII